MKVKKVCLQVFRFRRGPFHYLDLIKQQMKNICKQFVFDFYRDWIITVDNYIDDVSDDKYVDRAWCCRKREKLFELRGSLDSLHDQSSISQITNKKIQTVVRGQKLSVFFSHKLGCGF